MTRSIKEVRQEAHSWRAHIDAGLSLDEQREFERWMAAEPQNGEAFAEAEMLWKALEKLDYSKTENSASFERQIEEELDRPSATIHYLRFAGSRFGAALAAAAAVVAIMIFAGLPLDYFQPKPSEPARFATTATAKQVIVLPDESRITLEPNSEMTVDYRDDSRDIVLLSGSAAYNVRSNVSRPFRVQTPYANVRVTGTRFSTVLRGKGIQVAVIEGSVDVSPSAGKPGHAAVRSVAAGEAIFTTDGVRHSDVAWPYSKPTLKPQNNSTASLTTSVSAATSDRLRYVRAPLAQVIADINRIGGSDVRVDPRVADLRFSGTFDAGDPEAILATLSDALPVAINAHDGQRVIVPE